MNFFKELISDNHWKYLLLSLFGSIFFTFGFSVGMNFTSEYKNKLQNIPWNWKNIGFGLLGGFIGQLLEILLIYLLFI